ncbi:MAG TPA: glutamine amidotransferase [Candidatus Monoglobus merdigallinarum]|uniref:Lipid II isoglutaminyl synthase (glutamine-hydrolyzing) subunit GatD n=1 Tax=Candidatus Monoglobus merdigallinarum TaxID=2838698 RepID=A0A9D1PPS1_9FIRM|nr:glutamine amidotransferase [Candidatus Monoglobus merdigallinarum]
MENTNNYQINIVHLYPDLLNLYGDRGNIACMEKRLKWRGISANVYECTNSDGSADLSGADILFLGGGSDREQEIVCGLLRGKRDEIKAHVESGGALLAVCGGYQLLGKYYMTAKTKIEGLDILDIYTNSGDTRLIGNVVLKCPMFDRPVVGFENHAGRTYLGEGVKPLGQVAYGNGNTGSSGYEGVIYKNTVATYLHGPLLPKNPQLCDYILSCALKRKYPEFTSLAPLDDELENKGNDYIVKKYIG